MRIAFVALGLMVVAALSACGGDGGTTPVATPGGSELSLSEYFRQFDNLLNRYSSRQVDNGRELSDAYKSDAGLEQKKKALGTYLEKSQQEGQAYLQELGKLVPPPEVKDLHEQFLDLFTEGEGLLQAYTDPVASAQTDPAIDHLAAEFQGQFVAAGKRLDDVCWELQAIADQNGIGVKLACGGQPPGVPTAEPSPTND